MTDAEFKQRLIATRFVVDATHDEMFMLWEKFSNEAIYKHPDFNKFTFEQMNPGVSQQIGTLDERPVCISLFWWKIDGVQIMVMESTSQVVDHLMIEKWLEKNCSPRWDGGTRLAHCNAANFHHVLDFVKNEGKIDGYKRERRDALKILDEVAETRRLKALATLIK